MLFYSSVLCLHVECESSRVEEVVGHWSMGLQLSFQYKGFCIEKTTWRICSFAVVFFHEFWAGHLIFQQKIFLFVEE